MLKLRGQDGWGSGAYRASRGSRLHHGLDIQCSQDETIQAFSSGKVTKIGFPYYQGRDTRSINHTEARRFMDKKSLRYVQITDKYGIDARYFYITPLVDLGTLVEKGATIGSAQGVEHIYEHITEHYHFEVLQMVKGKKVFLDPSQYLVASGVKV